MRPKEERRPQSLRPVQSSMSVTDLFMMLQTVWMWTVLDMWSPSPAVKDHNRPAGLWHPGFSLIPLFFVSPWFHVSCLLIPRVQAQLFGLFSGLLILGTPGFWFCI